MTLVAQREAAALVLASLPDLTPGRRHRLLTTWPDPQAALEAVADGRADPVVGAALGAVPPGAVERAASLLARRRTRVLLGGDEGHPIDPSLPGRPDLLLVEGDRPELLDMPRVAVVGSRAATPHGLADAHALGAYLAAEGICVVSGMALGIDGAAHLGALSIPAGAGGPLGVLATGLDVVYPRRHVALFDRVRRHGLLVTEHGFGVKPIARHFPVRNRIIAALADVTVVVEASEKGGARITAERAMDYGRAVLALPGSRRNQAAAGCNALLADGAQPLLQPSDVLLALGMSPGARRGWTAPPPTPDGLSTQAAAVFRALGGEPAHPDELGPRTALDADAVALALEELLDAGRIERTRGYIWPL